MSAPSSDKSGVKRTYRALTEAGYSIVVVDGAGEEFTGLNEAEAVAEVMTCDDGYFVAYKDGERVGFVWFVYGNDPAEVVSDYAVSLEHVIGPLTSGWWN